jgi:hypothetical protein
MAALRGNTGHGHVRPRPDGVRVRCGGPGMCNECSIERAVVRARAEAEARLRDCGRSRCGGPGRCAECTVLRARAKRQGFEGRSRATLSRVVELVRQGASPAEFWKYVRGLLP